MIAETRHWAGDDGRCNAMNEQEDLPAALLGAGGARQRRRSLSGYQWPLGRDIGSTLRKCRGVGLQEPTDTEKIEIGSRGKE
jgi:hypothetical protein